MHIGKEGGFDRADTFLIQHHVFDDNEKKKQKVFLEEIILKRNGFIFGNTNPMNTKKGEAGRVLHIGQGM